MWNKILESFAELGRASKGHEYLNRLAKYWAKNQGTSVFFLGKWSEIKKHRFTVAEIKAIYEGMAKIRPNAITKEEPRQIGGLPVLVDFGNGKYGNLDGRRRANKKIREGKNKFIDVFLIKAKQPRVLIVGSSASVKKDLEQVDLKDFDAVIAVNRARELVEHDFFVTVHADRFERESESILYVANKQQQDSRVDIVFDPYWNKGDLNSGGSGLVAVKFALEVLNAETITLAGMGIDESPHFYDSKPWANYDKMQKAWTLARSKMLGKVTSLSGWTKQLLNSEVKK